MTTERLEMFKHTKGPSLSKRERKRFKKANPLYGSSQFIKVSLPEGSYSCELCVLRNFKRKGKNYLWTQIQFLCILISKLTQ